MSDLQAEDQTRRLINAQAVVDEQAEDKGLWFHAQTAPEAYLQEALRRLSCAVERSVSDPDEGINRKATVVIPNIEAACEALWDVFEGKPNAYDREMVKVVVDAALAIDSEDTP